MPRITAESLMAPGGLLDAGSRLTQTLLTVPFQREQFRAGLDEKSLMVKREDERIAKTDKIGYLKDRIATTQQRIADLRRALMLGDKTEASLALKALGKHGGSGDPKAMLDHADRVAAHEAKIREELKTKLGSKFATNETEADVKSAVAKFEQNDIERMKRDGLWHDNEALVGGASLKGIDLDAVKADPQLQTELDAALDQQSQLFGQYRELVGQAGDVVETRHFLQQSMPDQAPRAPVDKTNALAPPGSNPSDYTEIPPMVSMPGKAGAMDAYAAAVASLDSPDSIQRAAANANPLQQDQLMAQQNQSMPQLNADALALDQGVQDATAAGMAPNELQQIQGLQIQKQNAMKQAVRQQLTAQAFGGVVTPETLAATDQILATVAPSGQQMLGNELSGDAMAGQVNSQIQEPGIDAQYQGPRMTPHVLPRIRALAPPGMISPEQNQQQKQVRSRLSAQGLYPR